MPRHRHGAALLNDERPATRGANGSQAFLGERLRSGEEGVSRRGAAQPREVLRAPNERPPDPFEPGYSAADSRAPTPRLGGRMRSPLFTDRCCRRPRAGRDGQRPSAQISGEDQQGDPASHSPDRGPHEPETHHGARANPGQGHATPRRSHQRGTRLARSGSDHGDSNATDRHRRQRMSRRGEAVTADHDTYQRVKHPPTNVGSSRC